MLAYRSPYHIEETFKQMKDPHFLRWSPSHHWTDQKIRIHAFYCVLALLLSSVLHREVWQKGEKLSLSRLEELGQIRETPVIYPRRQLLDPHESTAAAAPFPVGPTALRERRAHPVELGHTATGRQLNSIADTSPC